MSQQATAPGAKKLRHEYAERDQIVIEGRRLIAEDPNIVQSKVYLYQKALQVLPPDRRKEVANAPIWFQEALNLVRKVRGPYPVPRRGKPRTDPKPKPRFSRTYIPPSEAPLPLPEVVDADKPAPATHAATPSTAAPGVLAQVFAHETHQETLAKMPLEDIAHELIRRFFAWQRTQEPSQFLASATSLAPAAVEKIVREIGHMPKPMHQKLPTIAIIGVKPQQGITLQNECPGVMVKWREVASHLQLPSHVDMCFLTRFMSHHHWEQAKNFYGNDKVRRLDGGVTKWRDEIRRFGAAQAANGQAATA